MKCAVDNTFLTLLLRPDSRVPDSKLGIHKPEEVPALITTLEADWDAQRATVLLPTPVLAEVLVGVDDRDALMAAIRGYSRFQITPFCERCALEVAIVTSRAILSGDKRGGVDAPWQKVKIDRQAVAIAKANGATHFYTTDKNQAAFAREAGIRHVLSLAELTLPPQREFGFDD